MATISSDFFAYSQLDVDVFSFASLIHTICRTQLILYVDLGTRQIRPISSLIHTICRAEICYFKSRFDGIFRQIQIVPGKSAETVLLDFLLFHGKFWRILAKQPRRRLKMRFLRCCCCSQIFSSDARMTVRFWPHPQCRRHGQNKMQYKNGENCHFIHLNHKLSCPRVH